MSDILDEIDKEYDEQVRKIDIKIAKDRNKKERESEKKKKETLAN